MEYIGKVFRPPSEAYSLIIQATLGCTHNKCTFCCMYDDKQFSVRPLAEVKADLHSAKKSGDYERIFLADGDALAAPQEYLEDLLKEINEVFPQIRRVAIYASARNILGKSDDELKRLSSLGLKMAYLGLESGSELILERIKKGITGEEMIAACHKLRRAGIKSSVTVISGLGGAELWKEHALETARVVSAMDPDYLGLLTLMIAPETQMAKEIARGELIVLTPGEVAVETKLMLENLNVSNCIFRSNHASNYLVLKGTLPQDRKQLIAKIDQALAGESGFKPEFLRQL